MPPSNRVRSIAEVVEESQKEAAKSNPENVMANIDNEADAMLQELKEDLDKPDIEAQRLADEESDFADTEYGKRLAAKAKAQAKRIAELEATIASKGMVLANSTPQRKTAKTPVDPTRLAVAPDKEGVLQFVNPYKNFPVREIDGKKVQFVSSRPFWDKQCAWDDGHKHNSEHFVQCEHPNYANAVYCHIPQFINFDKTVKDAYVIRTDEEIQLFFCV